MAEIVACQDCKWCNLLTSYLGECHHVRSAEDVPNFLAGSADVRYPNVRRRG